MQISSVKKCTESGIIHEKIYHYNENERCDEDFKDPDGIDASDNKQESHTIKISSSFNEKTSIPAFKTALEIRNEEISKTNSSANFEEVQFKKFSLKDDEINQNKHKKSINNSSNNIKETIYIDDIPRIQTLNDFVCARKIHESLSKTATIVSRSKIDKTISKQIKQIKVTDKSVIDKTKSKIGKTVYEQILASVPSTSKDSLYTKDSLGTCVEAKLKILNSVDSTIKDTRIMNKKKRSGSMEPYEDGIRPTENKRIKSNDNDNNKIDKYICNKKTKKILDDEAIAETIRNSVISTTVDINSTNKHSSIIKIDKIRKISGTETNLRLRNEHEADSRIENHVNEHHTKMKVHANKAMQFETAKILKTYLMRRYPSKLLPDRDTFSKTCREMHYDILKRRIYGKIILKIYIKNYT